MNWRDLKGEGVGKNSTCSKVLGSSPCKPIGCARSVWKWILQGYLIAPGNCLPFVWCHPRRQFPITQMELEANVGMPRLFTRSWQNLAVDTRRKRTLLSSLCKNMKPSELGGLIISYSLLFYVIHGPSYGQASAEIPLEDTPQFHSKNHERRWVREINALLGTFLMKLSVISYYVMSKLQVFLV